MKNAGHNREPITGIQSKRQTFAARKRILCHTCYINRKRKTLIHSRYSTHTPTVLWIGNVELEISWKKRGVVHVDGHQRNRWPICVEKWRNEKETFARGKQKNNQTIDGDFSILYPSWRTWSNKDKKEITGTLFTETKNKIVGVLFFLPEIVQFFQYDGLIPEWCEDR